jgi:YHS domain-containing protein
MFSAFTRFAGPGCLIVVGCAALCYSLAYSDDSATPRGTAEAAQAKAALAPLQGLVGEWNGAGQPRRGSNVGAWSETSAWAWHFSPPTDKVPTADLRATFKDGKYFSQIVIQPTLQAMRFHLTGTLPDGKSTEEFAATFDESGVLSATRVIEKGAAGKEATEKQVPLDRPARITIKSVANGDRLVVLYERAAGDGYARLAEVGATRVGGMFAAGAAGPECIVTGGRGTIAVTHQGQTYYVCCSGCKEAFDADPAGIVAEYLAKKKTK